MNTLRAATLSRAPSQTLQGLWDWYFASFFAHHLRIGLVITPFHIGDDAFKTVFLFLHRTRAGHKLEFDGGIAATVEHGSCASLDNSENGASGSKP